MLSNVLDVQLSSSSYNDSCGYSIILKSITIKAKVSVQYSAAEKDNQAIDLKMWTEDQSGLYQHEKNMIFNSLCENKTMKEEAALQA